MAAPFRVAFNRAYAEKIKNGTICSHPTSLVKGITLMGRGGGGVMCNLSSIIIDIYRYILSRRWSSLITLHA